MAKIVRLVCDAHLVEGEEVSASERNITIDGVRKKPHLCDECYDEHVAPLLAWLNSVDGTNEKPKKAGAAPKRSRSGGKSTSKAAKVRAWAQEQGMDVAPTGKLPRELFEQYDEAMAG